MGNTDTAGFTDHLFGISAMLGYRLILRIRDLCGHVLIAFESAAAVARNCKVSQTTVHRLAHHMGFQTFGEFRAMIRNHLRTTAADHR